MQSREQDKQAQQLWAEYSLWCGALAALGRGAQVEQLEHVLRKRGKVNVQRLFALEHLKVGLGHLELVEEERVALCARARGRVAKSRYSESHKISTSKVQFFKSPDTAPYLVRELKEQRLLLLVRVHCAQHDGDGQIGLRRVALRAGDAHGHGLVVEQLRVLQVLLVGARVVRNGRGRGGRRKGRRRRGNANDGQRRIAAARVGAHYVRGRHRRHAAVVEL